MENKKGHLYEIEVLINAKVKGVLVNTYEEMRFEKDLLGHMNSHRGNYDIYSYSVSSGLKNLKSGEVQKMPDPNLVINLIKDTYKPSIFILKDFHKPWSNPMINRNIRDFLEDISGDNSAHVCIMFLSPVMEIPVELEKVISSVDFDLPSRPEIRQHINVLDSKLVERGSEPLTERFKDSVENALVGMTLAEVGRALKKSVVKHGEIVLEDINKEKEDVIRKTGLLEYISNLQDMKNVGGLENLKEWLNHAKYSFDVEAKEYKIDPTRGVVLAGFPGTGKSLTAQSIASSWNLPLLKMEMGSIMDSLVGQSEKNIYRALKLAEAVSPCVLWIDEIEKSLSGLSSSGATDSGTMARVFSTILTWMSDRKDPVFVVATANDITSLPPELTRAGRFDEIFFLSVPGPEERKEILKIHLNRRGYEESVHSDVLLSEGKYSEDTLQPIVDQTHNFTGAEIEQVIRDASRKSYAEFVEKKKPTHFTTEMDLLDAAKKLIPLSSRTPDLLSNLRNWAKYSAVCASKEEHDIIHSVSKESNEVEQGDDSLNLFDDF